MHTHTTPLSKNGQKLIRALARKKKRREHGLFLAEGVRLVNELAACPERIEFLYARPESLDLVHDALRDQTTYVLEEEAPDLFSTENPQGLGAVVRMAETIEPGYLQELRKPSLLLDGLSDPGNVGTILRAADWFGLGAVLFAKDSVDPYNPKVVRASMGAIFRLPMMEGLTPDMVQGLGRPVYALDAGGELQLGKDELPENGIFIVGNEAHGVSDAWRKVSHVLSIPGAGRGESLNAAMAATVLCWELSRLDQGS